VKPDSPGNRTAECDGFGMAYWKTFYHLVWTTKGRDHVIGAKYEETILSRIHAKAGELDLFVLAIGIVPDHVHVVAQIPPRLAVADCVRHLKGATSYALNQQSDSQRPPFRWQEGYGVITFGERSLATVVEYVGKQKEHHGNNTVIALFERTEEPTARTRTAPGG